MSGMEEMFTDHFILTGSSRVQVLTHGRINLSDLSVQAFSDRSVFVLIF